MINYQDARDIQDWWAQNPMTYGATHGRTEYADGRYEPGTQEFFDRLDREFYSWNTPLHKNRPFDLLFHYERYAEASRVLEVGCGLGTMAMNWAQHGMKVTAVDLNPTSVEMTRRRFALYGLEGDIRLEDARALPFEDGRFDYGYSWGVLHHSPDLEQSVKELTRVIKPGGGYGIMLYNRRSILYRYVVQYTEGFLHYENQFLGPLELASRYGDGDTQEGNPHTWPITAGEARDLLRPFSRNVRVKCLGTDLDSAVRRILPIVGRRVPVVALKSWARRFGWSLWIYGNKD